MDFLREDLKHLFDEQGIDKSAYEDRVKFRDPLTKYDTVWGECTGHQDAMFVLQMPTRSARPVRVKLLDAWSGG